MCASCGKPWTHAASSCAARAATLMCPRSAAQDRWPRQLQLEQRALVVQKTRPLLQQVGREQGKG
eukprot:1017684-Pelagomonas_calceolata.AAC.7